MTNSDDSRQSMLSVPARWSALYFDIFYILCVAGVVFVVCYGIFSRQPDESALDVAADILLRLAAVPIVAALLAFIIMRVRDFAMKTWETFRLERYNKGREDGMKMGREVGREEGIEVGREEGIEAGREEGIEAGREEGIEVGRGEERARHTRDTRAHRAAGSVGARGARRLAGRNPVRAERERRRREAAPSKLTAARGLATNHQSSAREPFTGEGSQSSRPRRLACARHPHPSPPP